MEKIPEINTNFKGKRVGGFMYIHKSGQKLIASNYSDAIEKSLPLLSDFATWNVIKLNIKNPEQLSFLEYESFEQAELSWPPKTVPVFVDQWSGKEWHGNGIRMRTH